MIGFSQIQLMLIELLEKSSGTSFSHHYEGPESFILCSDTSVLVFHREMQSPESQLPSVALISSLVKNVQSNRVKQLPVLTTFIGAVSKQFLCYISVVTIGVSVQEQAIRFHLLCLLGDRSLAGGFPPTNTFSLS